MDCNSPVSSVHGLLQVRILEWAAIPFSGESSQPKNWTQVSCSAGGYFTLWALFPCQFHNFLPLGQIYLWLTHTSILLMSYTVVDIFDRISYWRIGFLQFSLLSLKREWNHQSYLMYVIEKLRNCKTVMEIWKSSQL